MSKWNETIQRMFAVTEARKVLLIWDEMAEHLLMYELDFDSAMAKAAIESHGKYFNGDEVTPEIEFINSNLGNYVPIYSSRGYYYTGSSEDALKVDAPELMGPPMAVGPYERIIVMGMIP